MFPNPFKRIKEIVSQSNEPSDYDLQMMSEGELLDYSRRLRGETQQLCQKIAIEKRQKIKRMQAIEESMNQGSPMKNQYSEPSKISDDHSDLASNNEQVVNQYFEDFLNKLQS